MSFIEGEDNQILLVFEGAPRSKNYDLFYYPSIDSDEASLIFENEKYSDLVNESQDEMKVQESTSENDDRATDEP